jgi:hypothetical protein
MRACFSIIAAFLLIAIAAARENPLSVSELEKVKRICASLLGTHYGSQPWRRLEPYYRDEHAVDPEIVCSASSCGGGVELRGGYSVTYLYPNTENGPGKPWGSRDALVWSISIRKGDKVIFHREKEPET